MSKIYRNDDNYRVLAVQFTGNNPKQIQKLVGLPVGIVLGKPNKLKVNYENVYPGDWVVRGIGQIEFEILSNRTFRQSYKPTGE